MYLVVSEDGRDLCAGVAPEVLQAHHATILSYHLHYGLCYPAGIETIFPLAGNLLRIHPNAKNTLRSMQTFALDIYIIHNQGTDVNKSKANTPVQNSLCALMPEYNDLFPYVLHILCMHVVQIIPTMIT